MQGSVKIPSALTVSPIKVSASSVKMWGSTLVIAVLFSAIKMKLTIPTELGGP